MKILYLANYNNTGSNFIEEDIKEALDDLGHEVIPIHETEIKKVLDVEADMMLFHKAGIGKNITAEDWTLFLNRIICKKVMWFFDPVALSYQREADIETIIPYIDYGFMVDDTWRRRHKYENLYSLKEGIGKIYQGKVRPEFKCDIAFVGNIYGEREEFIGTLKKVYGERFKVFNNVFGQDLADLCVSAKIIVAPDFPTNEFYWSSRIYLTLGLGGFLVHPDCYGLREELKEGTHFAGYKNMNELLMTIDYFIEHEEEREAIRKQGQQKCLENFTFKHRLETMLNTIFPKKDEECQSEKSRPRLAEGN